MAETENRGNINCCGCLLHFLFTAGLTALFMWLSLRTSNPTISIQNFYIPALNATNNSPTNHSLYFDLRLKNEMSDKGVHYGNISLTFFYNNSLNPIANFTVPQFYQGRKKKARRREVVEVTGLPWDAALEAVSNGSRVGFRVGLVTRVRFKILFWYTKRHGLVVGGDVAVDGSGQKVGRKGIKLKSGVSGRNTNWVGGGVGWAVLLILFL